MPWNAQWGNAFFVACMPEVSIVSTDMPYFLRRFINHPTPDSSAMPEHSHRPLTAWGVRSNLQNYMVGFTDGTANALLIYLLPYYLWYWKLDVPTAKLRKKQHVIKINSSNAKIYFFEIWKTLERGFYEHFPNCKNENQKIMCLRWPTSNETTLKI